LGISSHSPRAVLRQRGTEICDHIRDAIVQFSAGYITFDQLEFLYRDLYSPSAIDFLKSVLDLAPDSALMKVAKEIDPALVGGLRTADPCAQLVRLCQTLVSAAACLPE